MPTELWEHMPHQPASCDCILRAAAREDARPLPMHFSCRRAITCIPHRLSSAVATEAGCSGSLHMQQGTLCAACFRSAGGACVVSKLTNTAYTTLRESSWLLTPVSMFCCSTWMQFGTYQVWRKCAGCHLSAGSKDGPCVMISATTLLCAFMPGA